MIEFADLVLDVPLDPWQKWLVVHAGELLDDGRPRFRTVLVLVARQNGKTLVAKVVTLWWLVIEQIALVLATSTSRIHAKEAWRDTCEMAKLCPHLHPTIRETIGEEQLVIDGARYLFAATTRRAGRSLTVHRLVLDEIREHHTWEAWGAATNAMQAVADGQILAISNQGDERSVVLDSLRSSALTYIERGTGDPRLGLFEWSAPIGCDPADPAALAYANPDLGNRIQLDTLTGAAERAKASGGEELAVFKTEVLCQRVRNLDGAIDEGAWNDARSASPVDLAAHRQRVALCLDVALDGSHATLAAAAVIDGTVHLDVVAAWDGPGCTAALKAELPEHVAKVRPRMVGWFPKGPAAALTASLRSAWHPPRTEVVEIKAELAATCMGFADEVTTPGSLRHPGDPLLDAHVLSAQRLRIGDTWVFTRRGTGPIDACYAAAGAVQLARTMPAPQPPLVIL